jgi:hypothetical protein
MKFIQSGKIKPDVLELPIKIQPYEWVRSSSLKRLNYLLNFVKEKRPEAISSYLANLEAKYGSLVEKDLIAEKSIGIKDIISNFDALLDYVKLAENLLNFVFQSLFLPLDKDWSKDEVEVKNEYYLHSFLRPRYFNLLVLIETLGREEGIDLYKQYVTHYYRDNQEKRENFVDLETLFEQRRKSTAPLSEWQMVSGMIGKGKYAYRNDNCFWIDVLTEITDKELVYLICCYGDYQAAKNFDENMVLTMEHTIAEGDSYCSRVLHDTRVDWNLKHPKKEFWDKMKPE